MSRKVLMGLGIVMLLLVANVIRRKIISGRVPAAEVAPIVGGAATASTPGRKTDVSLKNRNLQQPNSFLPGFLKFR